MRKKIFVVEKDDEVLQMIEHMLQEEGYEVFTSNTEFGIFEQIRRSRPDVILLDLINSTVQGTELSRAIKSEDDIKHIPVVALSSHLKPGPEIDEYNTRAFDSNMLLKVVEEQLVAG